MVSFRQEEEHAIIVIAKGMLLVVFWAATWGLIDDGIERVKEKTTLSIVHIHFILLAIVVTFFLVFPSLLVKL